MRENELNFAEFAIELPQFRLAQPIISPLKESLQLRLDDPSPLGYCQRSPKSLSTSASSPYFPCIPNGRLAYLPRNHILCQVKKIFF
ncbi:hypothetical protein QUA86_07955 [Microcoleus sp. F6_B6]